MQCSSRVSGTGRVTLWARGCVPCVEVPRWVGTLEGARVSRPTPYGRLGVNETETRAKTFGARERMSSLNTQMSKPYTHHHHYPYIEHAMHCAHAERARPLPPHNPPHHMTPSLM